jgi:hypothetical protein
VEDDLNRLLLVVGAFVVILGYVLLIAWRVRVRRERNVLGGPPPEATGPPTGSSGPTASPGSFDPPRRMSRAERKAAAVLGTTPEPRRDLKDAEARVLATAARLAGREPDPSPPRDTDIDTDADTEADAAPAPTAPADPPASGTDAPSLFRPTATWHDDDAPPASPPPAATVAELLTGIRVPDSLAPLTDLLPRVDVVDHIAFIATAVPAEQVAPEFTLELQRLGFTTTFEGYDTMRITRGPDVAMVAVHSDAGQLRIDGRLVFPSAPPLSTVVEVWIPTG